MYEFLTIAGLGFLLGIRHALEPDHMITVSTIATRHKEKKDAALTGFFWGLGHGVTLLIIVSVVLLFRLSLSPLVFQFFETVVAIVLIVLGIRTFAHASRLHSHQHTHNDEKHMHPHTKHRHRHHTSFLIGIVHGLAGSGSIIVLIATTIKNVALGLIYVSFLGLGAIAGMVILSGVLGVSFGFTSSRYLQLTKILIAITGAVSIAFGVYLLVLRF